MKRETDRLAGESFDLLVVGGGINGLCAAMDAAQRGLRTALIDKQDFGGASSAGSYKILHGGLRYLQHLNFKRMRSSIRERRFMMQAAPHLVTPLSFLVPCKGFGIKSPEAMRTALWLNDLISHDRNHGLETANHLPGGRILSNEDAFAMAPFLPQEGNRGAALFYDGQMLHSERFSLAIAQSAAAAGACMANYVKLIDFELDQQAVSAAQVRDELTGREFSIRCKSVLNLAGPWNHGIIQTLTGRPPEKPVRFSKGIQLFTQGEIVQTGFTFESNEYDATAVVQRGARLYFGTPFRGTTFWGTTESVYEGDPDDFAITEEDADGFLNEINQALPSLTLSRDNILGACGGLRPLDPKTGAAANQTETINHLLEDHIKGMVTGRGIKYTTCREFAEQLVDKIYHQLDRQIVRPSSAQTKLEGAPEGPVSDIRNSLNTLPLKEETRRRLTHHYGVHAGSVASSHQDLSDGKEALINGEVDWAIDHEMAVHLDDVLLRRTSAGNPGRPDAETLQAAARYMASRLDWDAARVSSEIERVDKAYPEWLKTQAEQTPG